MKQSEDFVDKALKAIEVASFQRLVEVWESLLNKLE